MLGFADDLDLSALTNDQIKGEKSVLTENAAKAGLRIYRGGVMNKQYTAVIDTTSYLGNALNYLGGPDDNQMKNQD